MILSLLGQTLPLFLGLTLILFGGAAVMMGRAIASIWHPAWKIWPYGFLLGAFDRFLSYALFGQPLLHVPGFVLNSLVLVGLALLAYRITLAGKMVRQYPWLYERAGPFAYREAAKV